MRRLRVVWFRVRTLFCSRALDRELADEIRSHFAEARTTTPRRVSHLRRECYG
jgi:hypothetical protein